MVYANWQRCRGRTRCLASRGSRLFGRRCRTTPVFLDVLANSPTIARLRAPQSPATAFPVRRTAVLKEEAYVKTAKSFASLAQSHKELDRLYNSHQRGLLAADVELLL